MTKPTQSNSIHLTRVYDAPLKTIFDMWTSPERLAQWLPPTGFDMKFIECDLSEGESSFYSMSGANFTLYGKSRYLEIRSPNRVVYTQQFSDQHGNVSRHPLAPTWPETMKTTVELEAALAEMDE